MAAQAAISSAPYALRPDSFSGEALAQYRITHPDKLLKYASKALAETGRLPDHFDAVSASAPAVSIATDDETPEQANARMIKEKEAAAVKALEEDAADAAGERAYKEDLARLELLRVKRQIAKNLAQERKAQAEAGRYRQEMLDTVARTEQVRAQVKEHYFLLEKMKRDKEAKMKAAELVDKIKAKKLSKAELQAKIDGLRTSIDSHKQVQDRLATVARERHAKFAEASRLIDEARALELPALTPPGEVADVEPVEAEPKARTTQTDGRDRDRPAATSSSGSASGSASKLTPTTLPFTPSATTSSRAAQGSSSQASSRGGTPAPRSVPTGPSGGSASASGSGSGSASASGGPSRPPHLPSRPSAPTAKSSPGGSRPATLPARPTTLRTVTGPSGTSSTAAVEEGELPDERRSTDVRGTGAVSMRQQAEAKDTGASGARGSGVGDRTREAGAGGRGVKRGAGNEPDRGGRPLTRGRR